MSSLFPSHAVAGGEIEWLKPDLDGLYEAGINERPPAEMTGESAEWEWTEKHSAWTYVQTFKREGLL